MITREEFIKTYADVQAERRSNRRIIAMMRPVDERTAAEHWDRAPERARRALRDANQLRRILAGDLEAIDEAVLAAQVHEGWADEGEAPR